jgi:hypothetical protein
MGSQRVQIRVISQRANCVGRACCLFSVATMCTLVAACASTGPASSMRTANWARFAGKSTIPPCRNFAETSPQGARSRPIAPKGAVVPQLHGPYRVDPYTIDAKRMGGEGIVDLQFTVDARGKARHVRVILPRRKYIVIRGLHFPNYLVAGAVRFLRAVKFDVPRNWGRTAAVKRVFTVEFLFLLETVGPPDAICAPPPNYKPSRPGALVIYVRGSLYQPGHLPPNCEVSKGHRLMCRFHAT